MSRSIQLLRTAGLGSCLISVVFSGIEQLYRRAGGSEGSLCEVLARLCGLSAIGIFVLQTCLGIFLCVAFWLCTRESELFRPRRRTIWLVAAQALVAAMTFSELLLLIAIEVAFLLERRAAWTWIIAQSILQVGCWYLQIWITGTHPLMSIFRVEPGAVWLGMGLMAVTSQIWHYLAFGLGILAANENRQARELIRINAELRATRQIEADTARLAERLNLSRELHDASGHHLAALSVNLRLMRRLEDRESLDATIEESLGLVQRLLTDIRSVVRDLRDMRAVDLRSAVRTMADGLQGIQVHLNLDDALAAAEPYHAHALFRCAQEILTNTMNHSGARNVWLTIEAMPDGFRLDAHDDGRGASRIEFGNGLRGMSERVSELGGEFEVHTREGEGFRVVLVLPVRTRFA